MTYPSDGQIVLNVRPDEKSKLLKTDILEGPINDVFKSSFIVVSGTLGSEEEKETIRAAADTFCNNWKKDFFNDCVRKNDAEVNDQDLSNSNLILIGSPNTNSIIRRFRKQIPLNVTNQYIEIKGKKYSGRTLGYSLVYPNPANNKRYFLIIGSNHKETAWRNIRDFPLKGWYDYEIWYSDPIVEGGYFNKYWR